MAHRPRGFVLRPVEPGADGGSELGEGEGSMIPNGIDIKETEVEIRVVRDRDGTYRLWINAPLRVLRAYKVPALHLTGLALTDQEEEKTA
jgi:hypothetical protein